MNSPERRQIRFAEDLADELESCGHEDIAALDILDALASCGLRLASIDNGVNVASLAYFSEIEKEATNE